MPYLLDVRYRFLPIDLFLITPGFKPVKFRFRFASKRLRKYSQKWIFLLICGMPVTGSTYLLSVNSAFSETKFFKTQKHDVIVEDIASNLNHPWGLAFLPDGSFLVTGEKVVSTTFAFRCERYSICNLVTLDVPPHNTMIER